MPLRAGSSRKTIGSNIREFHHGSRYQRTLQKFGKKRADAQSVAVALKKAGKSRYESVLTRMRSILEGLNAR